MTDIEADSERDSQYSDIGSDDEAESVAVALLSSEPARLLPTYPAGPATHHLRHPEPPPNPLRYVMGRYNVTVPLEMGPHLIINPDGSGIFRGGDGTLSDVQTTMTGWTARFVRKNLSHMHINREGTITFEARDDNIYVGHWTSDTGNTSPPIILEKIDNNSSSRKRKSPAPPKKKKRKRKVFRLKQEVVEPVMTPAPFRRRKMKWRVGDIVEVLYHERHTNLVPHFYPAMISEVNSDGTYNIDWDDGDRWDTEHRLESDIRDPVPDPYLGIGSDDEPYGIEEETRYKRRTKKYPILPKPQIAAKPSKYIGVRYLVHSRKWIAERVFDGKIIKSEQRYENEKDAARASDQLVILNCSKAKKAMRLNFPENVDKERVKLENVSNAGSYTVSPRDPGAKKGSTSKYFGVHWYSRDQRWRASYKGCFLGSYDDELEAALAVNRRCRELGVPIKNLAPEPKAASGVRKKRRKTSSKYRGVSLHRSGSWRAYVDHLGKRYNLGDHRDEKDAARAVNKCCDDIGIARRNPDVDAMTSGQRKKYNCSSQYRGVSLQQTGKWKAYVDYQGKRYHLGDHKVEKDAARAVNKCCDELGLVRRNPDVDAVVVAPKRKVKEVEFISESDAPPKKKRKKKNKSRYHGLRQKHGKWEGRGSIDGKTITLARAATEEECARLVVRKVAELKAKGCAISNPNYGKDRIKFPRSKKAKSKHASKKFINVFYDPINNYWKGRMVRGKVKAQSNHKDELTCAQLLNQDARDKGLVPPNPVADEIVNPQAQQVGNLPSQKSTLELTEHKKTGTLAEHKPTSALTEKKFQDALVAQTKLLISSFAGEIRQERARQDDKFLKAQDEREKLWNQVQKQDDLLKKQQKQIEELKSLIAQSSKAGVTLSLS